jgi:hypothetical protein
MPGEVLPVGIDPVLVIEVSAIIRETWAALNRLGLWRETPTNPDSGVDSRQPPDLR